MDGTLALGRAAAAAGIDTLVATPHVSARYPTSAEVMQRGVDGVNRAFTDAGVPVTVRPGGEIDIMSAAQLDDDERRALRLGGGDWLLLECPLPHAAAAPFELVLYGLQARGHRLVLAHPERSALIRRRPALLSDLVDAGMLSSITAGSLVGRFGDEIRRFSLEMLEAGLVHNVTSDAHDAKRRPPGLRDEIALAARAPRRRGAISVASGRCPARDPRWRRRAAEARAGPAPPTSLVAEGPAAVGPRADIRCLGRTLTLQQTALVDAGMPRHATVSIARCRPSRLAGRPLSVSTSHSRFQNVAALSSARRSGPKRAPTVPTAESVSSSSAHGSAYGID